MDGAIFVINNIQKDVESSLDSVVNTVMLIESGATIPFIARYRKEKTGGLDEVVIRKISDRLDYYRQLEERKAAIMKSIDSQGKMTEDLKKKLLDCTDKAVLEDMYLPFKPNTRRAPPRQRKKGLSLFPTSCSANFAGGKTKEDLVAPFINKEKNVEKYEDAVAGAKDIIAERIADNAVIRGWVRNYTADTGVLKSMPRTDFKDVKTKFSTYYETSELIKSAPSHRLLAIRRGTKEEVLLWKLLVDDVYIVGRIQATVIKKQPLLFKAELQEASQESYTRLMEISIAAEVFIKALEKAEEEAISVFSKNLRNLLLAPPAGSKITIGIDPGFRSGCKLTVVDEKGDFKEFNTIYPTPPENDALGLKRCLLTLLRSTNPS